MKLAALNNPVHVNWFTEQGTRLDAAPYLSGAYEARKLLERLSVEKELLSSLTIGHDGGIFNGPQFRRVYMNDTQHGVPFMGSTDMMEADLGWLPLLRKKEAESFPYLEIKPGMTLISCSGTIGRMSYARSDMSGIWSSQHVMKVNPDPNRIQPGYLNAFLQSRYGIPIITSQASGSIIQHIEPSHIADLPVPRFELEVEGRIHSLIQQAADLRERFQKGVREATQDLFKSAGIPELGDLPWHKKPRALGFPVHGIRATTLRASNYDTRALEVTDLIRSVPHKTLGEICAGGSLNSGARFKRIDSDSEHGGSLLVGQKDGFWMRPEGRWINPARAPREIFAVDETVMIASQGLPGETALICRATFVTGQWLEHVYTQHFLRAVSGDPEIPGAYLFAFLRSESAFRSMRAMLVGTGPQDIHPVLRAQLPVPICKPADVKRIANTVRLAYRDRDEADRSEDQALRLLDEAVHNAAQQP
ncbi:restriction endonuclease subunit S [Streptomyces virginiae]|uniref:methylation-associated defense system restriction endonuclease subunit S MAD5 n=1 Tax=Streptomyces virginiae TaxID=1961 RepID=UPI00366917FA